MEDKLKEELEKMTKEKNQLSDLLREEKQNTQMLAQKINELMQAFQQYQTDSGGYIQNLNNQHANTLSQLQNEFNNLKLQFEQATKRNQELNDQITRLNNEPKQEKIESEDNKLKEEIATLNTKFSLLSEEMKQLKLEKEVKENEIASLKREKDNVAFDSNLLKSNFERKIKSIEDSNIDLTNELEKALNKVADLEKDRSVKQEIPKANAEPGITKEEFDEVRSSNKRLNLENYDLKRKAEEAEKRLKDQAEFFNHKISDLMKGNEDNSASYREKEMQLNKLKSEVIELTNKVSEVTTYKDNQISQLRKSYEEYSNTKEKEIEVLTGQVNNLKEQLTNLINSKNTNDALSQNIAKTEQYYKDKIMENERLHMTERQSYEMKIRSLKTEMLEQQKKYDDLTNKNKLILDELSNYQKKSMLFRPVSNEQDKLKNMIIEPVLGERPLVIQGDFSSGKDYVDYTINLVLQNDVEFKCFRRYKYFDILNSCLLSKYPYYAIPTLPEKKLINLNTSEREKKLNFYINCLHNHEELSKTEEYNLFVNEFTFNDSFFEKRVNYLELPSKEYEKLNSSIYLKVTGLWTTKAETNQNNFFILNKRGFFKSLQERYTELLEQIKKYTENLKCSESSYKTIQQNILCFYDFNKKRVEYCEISNKIQKGYSLTSFYLDCLDLIETEASNAIDFLYSINAAFERWEKFLEIYERILKAREEHSRGEEKYNIAKLNAELTFANNVNKKFEESLKKEVANFEKNYSNAGAKIVSKFSQLVNYKLKKELSVYK